ncbi:hypothetical protein L7F22_067127 [Adiantum nelumboides]|nr:hypothetical protein [Adiantum nelumboides]
MTKLEQKVTQKELKQIVKQAWSTKWESEKEKASNAISVPSHYKRYIVEDIKILLQKPIRKSPGEGQSYDCPHQSNSVDLAQEGEEPKPVFLANDLTLEKEALLIDTLKHYRDIFAWSLKDLKEVDPTVCQHTIPMRQDAKPRKLWPYIKVEIDRLREVEFIYEIEHTEWVSLIVVVPKKNGKLWVWVNLKKVNATTIQDNYPLPITEHVLE